MLKRSLLTRLVPALAAAKLALGLVALFATYDLGVAQEPHYPYSFFGLLPAAFGATAALLLLGGREDRRAVTLGGFFMVTATAWSNKPLTLLTMRESGVSLFSLADALELDAFMAWFLWTFVRDFPSPPTSLSSRRRIQLAIFASAAVGLLFFTFNLLGFAARHAPGGSGVWEALAWFAPRRGQGVYYVAVLALTGGAFSFLLWKARFAQWTEQRRARLFLQLLALTLGPMIVEVLLELFVPGYREFILSHQRIKRG
ncbi:MAG TPA: hypothetical protein VGG03_22260, partial [Thermoanaerobaculia bacterium]